MVFSVFFFHQKEQYRHAKPQFSAFQLNSLNSKCVRWSPVLLVLKSCITVSFALQKAQQKPLENNLFTPALYLYDQKMV